LLTGIRLLDMKPVNKFLPMAAPKGGRGVKAPYTTTHVRVPEPIKARVEAMSQAYKDGALSEPINFDEAVEIAHKILKQKKSAKVSVQNLLTAIYGKEVSL
jgi:hypothetical protein